MILTAALSQTIQDCGNGSYQILNDPRPRLTIADYIGNAEEGDLILGAKNGRALQTVFRKTTGSCITHVAIVVKNNDGSLAVLDASPRINVRLYDLEKYLKTYSGRLCIKRRIGQEAGAELIKFSKEQVGQPYASLKELARVPFNLPIIKEGRELVSSSLNRSWFCSNLTTTIAQLAGWIDQSINPNSIEPVDLFLSDNLNWEVAQVLHPR